MTDPISIRAVSRALRADVPVLEDDQFTATLAGIARHTPVPARRRLPVGVRLAAVAASVTVTLFGAAYASDVLLSSPEPTLEPSDRPTTEDPSQAPDSSPRDGDVRPGTPLTPGSNDEGQGPDQGPGQGPDQGRGEVEAEVDGGGGGGGASSPGDAPDQAGLDQPEGDGDDEGNGDDTNGSGEPPSDASDEESAEPDEAEPDEAEPAGAEDGEAEDGEDSTSGSGSGDITPDEPDSEVEELAEHDLDVG